MYDTIFDGRSLCLYQPKGKGRPVVLSTIVLSVVAFAMYDIFAAFYMHSFSFCLALFAILLLVSCQENISKTKTEK